MGCKYGKLILLFLWWQIKNQIFLCVLYILLPVWHETCLQRGKILKVYLYWHSQKNRYAVLVCVFSFIYLFILKAWLQMLLFMFQSKVYMPFSIPIPSFKLFLKWTINFDFSFSFSFLIGPCVSHQILYFFSPKNKVGNPAVAVFQVTSGLSDVWVIPGLRGEKPCPMTSDRIYLFD